MAYLDSSRQKLPQTPEKILCLEGRLARVLVSRKIQLVSYLVLRKKALWKDSWGSILFYGFQSIFHHFELVTIVRLLDIAIHLLLRTIDIGFEAFSDKRKVDRDSQYPSNTSQYESYSHERSESPSNTRDEVGPEHLPWRTDILHKLIESRCTDGFDQSLDLMYLIEGKCFKRFLFLIGEFFYFF